MTIPTKLLSNTYTLLKNLYHICNYVPILWVLFLYFENSRIPESRWTIERLQNFFFFFNLKIEINNFPSENWKVIFLIGIANIFSLYDLTVYKMLKQSQTSETQKPFIFYHFAKLNDIDFSIGWYNKRSYQNQFNLPLTKVSKTGIDIILNSFWL